VLVPEPEGGFSAYILELPGCTTQGETLEEAYKRLDTLLLAYLKAAEEDGAEVPKGGDDPSEIPNMAPFGRYLRLAVRAIVAKRGMLDLPFPEEFYAALGEGAGKLAAEYMRTSFSPNEVERRLSSWLRMKGFPMRAA
jgi:predicted RNase H-like HicB family nuclease